MIVQDELAQAILQKAQAAKQASKTCAILTAEQKNQALLAMADALWQARAEILAANAQDVEEARRNGQTEGRIDRLALNEKRIGQMIEGLKQVADLPDPVGDCLETIERPNGLHIEKVRVPMGVIAMVYESRPNVTVDAAALVIKTGNAVVLRGGKEALHSNMALVQTLRNGLKMAGLPEEAIQFVDRVERESIDILIQARGLVDLAIPRGGAGLIQRVISNAHVPVIETGIGNCHVYIDEHADLAKADQIVLNAKTSRPSVCNAMETLLVHQDAAKKWLPHIVKLLLERDVEIRGCERTLQLLGPELTSRGQVLPASEEDWSTEYSDLILAVKVVDSLEEALDHIARYGTSHSEAIVTENGEAAEQFLKRVDAAAVYHNASTRFTDGFEFGFGAEIGISTQKLHARGPMGLREITSYKYIIRGNGQIRS